MMSALRPAANAAYMSVLKSLSEAADYRKRFWKLNKNTEKMRF